MIAPVRPRLLPTVTTDEGRMPLPAWADVVPLSENRSALRAVRRVAAALAGPGRVKAPFAPLVLHGPPGTGKTHLASALVRAVIAGPAVRTVQAVAANDLDRQADDDSSPGDLADLAGCDLLVLEDLQHLPPGAAAAVCRLLDQRNARRLPTVVTAHAGPARLRPLPQRLTSRLAAGLVVQLEPLSPASRRELLAFLADRRGLKLTADARDWLAGRATGGGARPLIGVLEKLKALARGKRGPLDREAVSALLADSDANGPAGVERIVARVAAAFGVKPRELLGPSRLRAVLVPRQVAMYLAREAAKLSLPQIGRQFGGRDHTTVLHAVRTIRNALSADAALAGTVRQLWAELT
jgi:chromosomal replication initiator protein